MGWRKSCDQLLGEEVSYAADSLADARSAAGVTSLAGRRSSPAGPSRAVPALAQALSCCRRTVRRWLHAFLTAGLAGLQDGSGTRAKQQARVADSAKDAEPPTTGGRLVPVVPVSIPELRRILAFHWFNDPVSPGFFWHWSTYRRYKQALAKRSHYKKRGAIPPKFERVRL